MRTKLILLAVVAAFAAAGCIRIDFTIDVQEDGTTTVEGISAFDFESFGGLLEDFGEGAGIPGQDQLCGDFESELGIDQGDFNEVKPYNEDGFCGVEFKTTFDADEFGSVIGGVNTGGGTLRREGEGWYFELPLDATQFDSSEAEILPGFEDILGDASYIVRVRLPGEQVEHNGEIDGDGFVVWDVDITNPPASLFLRTEPGDTITGDASVSQSGGGGDDGGGGNAIGVIIIVLIVLGGLGAAAYFLMRNRNTGDGAAAAAVAASDGSTPVAPPVDPSAPERDFTAPTEPGAGGATAAAAAAAAASEPVSEPVEPSTASSEATDPQVIASPTPEQATGEPVWDPVRRKYVQWDPTSSRWLVFDDASQTWGPEA